MGPFHQNPCLKKDKLLHLFQNYDTGLQKAAICSYLALYSGSVCRGRHSLGGLAVRHARRASHIPRQEFQ